MTDIASELLHDDLLLILRGNAALADKTLSSAAPRCAARELSEFATG